MGDLSEEQAERARTLRERKRRRAELREQNYEDGGVERDLSSFFSGLAGNYQSVGVLEVHAGDVAAAREAFADATSYYRRSADEDPSAVHSTRQRLQGIYTAALAGSSDDVVALAESVQSLARDRTLEPDEHNADRFYAATCLAGALLDDVDDSALRTLATINDEKSGAHAAYGRSIVEFCRGLRDGDTETLADSITSMLSYHEQDMDEENVVKQIMSVQATALLVLARASGHQVSVASEYVPEQLVEDAVDDLDLR